MVRPNLPALADVKGGFNLQSKQTIQCSTFQNEHSASGVIQGTFVCDSNQQNVNSLGTGTSTASGASASNTKGAAAHFGISEAAAGLSVVGGLLQILL